MSKSVRKYFEQEFKEIKHIPIEAQLDKLLNLKRSKPAEFYKDIIQAFHKTLPTSSTQLLNSGKQEYRNILWGPVGITTSLENEFEFVSEWLISGKPTINSFRRKAELIQAALLTVGPAAALEHLDDFETTYGLSIWGVEVRFCLTDLLHGSSRVREISNQLIEETKGRYTALLAQVLRDRNDDALALEVYFEKCNNSFKSDNWDDPFKTYFFYRASCSMPDTESSLCTLLSYDICSSSIDLYETFIDVITYLAVSKKEVYGPLIKKTIRKLIENGIEDFRLRKLVLLYAETNTLSVESEIYDVTFENIVDHIYRDQDNSPSLQQSEFTRKLHEKIHTIHSQGTLAKSEVIDLLKTGVNLRGLSLGNVLTSFTMSNTNDFSKNRIIQSWGQFSSPNIRIEDYLYFTYSSLDELVTILQANSFNHEIDQKTNKLILLNSDSLSLDQDFDSDYTTLWICSYLIQNNRPIDAITILNKVTPTGLLWERQFNKVLIWAYSSKKDFEHGLELAAQTIERGHQYGYELPLDVLISENKWSAFKDLDPVLIGIISNAAYQTNNHSNAKYICGMACRKFYTSGTLDNISNNINAISTIELARLVSFLKTVWIDENLNMVGFQSTQEVRNNRIHIIQLLIQIDPANEISYADEIRELTLIETIWRGLRHINQTRIFVNEAAITRWAEKELSPEFERWKLLSRSSDSKVADVDQLIQEYLLSFDASSFKLISSPVSEGDAILLSIMDRLLRRFLQDPADGLDSYLSSRIRHGSLKGTILGPLEEAGLIGATDEEIRSFLNRMLGAANQEKIEDVLNAIKGLGDSILRIINRIVNEEIHILSAKNPHGKISVVLNKDFINPTFIQLIEESNFPFFVASCYHAFWNFLKIPLNHLSEYFRTNIKNEIQAEFDVCLEALSHSGLTTSPLSSSLKTVATTIQTQCDLIANWFNAGKSIVHETYTLQEAIEIAKASTKNVYRLFPAHVISNNIGVNSLPLTSFGLSAITDGLYVMFENAWKHSGFGADIESIELSCELDNENNILQIEVKNPVSESRYKELISGEYNEICKRIDMSNIEKAKLEGGSGIPKLCRLVRKIDNAAYPTPLSIMLSDSSHWTVKICIPLYPRGAAFDAYFE